MLGCQDFCGYYDWTFHYVRRRWGDEAVRRLWSEAIGGESQQHYAAAAEQAGLRGLFDCWTKTGHDEHCDWTFTLDEERNALRMDMRRCPSKGFLTAGDRQADVDYCDHCIGWMTPLLGKVNVEVVEHAHNHSGQCWAWLRTKGLPSECPEVDCDIRRDPRWNFGYLDRWQGGRQLPLAPELGPWTDPCDLLEAWARGSRRFVVLDSVPGRPDAPVDLLPGDRVLATGPAYTAPMASSVQPQAVLVGQDNPDLNALAGCFFTAPLQDRPLLLHAYLPGLPVLDFVGHGLPRPVPVLPLLIRRGVYVHRPGGPHPGPAELLALLAKALDREAVRLSDLPEQPRRPFPTPRATQPP